MILADAFELVREIKATAGTAYSVVVTGTEPDQFVASMVDKRNGHEAVFDSKEGFRRVAQLSVGRPKVHSVLDQPPQQAVAMKKRP